MKLAELSDERPLTPDPSPEGEGRTYSQIRALSRGRGRREAPGEGAHSLLKLHETQ